MTESKRPTRVYTLPSGEKVNVHFDHGDFAPPVLSFQLKCGKIVHARRDCGTDDAFVA